jgi:hypothetical protein
VQSVEASVGVVALSGFEIETVGPRVVLAAKEVAQRLRQ